MSGPRNRVWPKAIWQSGRLISGRCPPLQIERAVTSELPIEHFYDLSRLSDAGADVVVAARADDLKKLALWLEAESVQKFEAKISLSRLALHRYRYDAVLVCHLTQASVVSLDPVHTRVEESFSRELHVAHRPRRPLHNDPEPVIAPAGDDGPEELDSPNYDLAGPLLEELVLALDPYPRAPGEAFADLEPPDAPKESPFAVLKRLKDSG
jgi:hypothetical protein